MALHATELFERYLWPLYPADARADLAAARTIDVNPAHNRGLVAHLDDAARVFASMAPALFGTDDPGLDRSDASVHRLGLALTNERRDAWALRGEPGTADNELFNVVVHASAYVGACVVAQHGGVWSVRRPLWESVVALSSHAGEANLAVLQWVIKSLADPAPGAPRVTLGDRYRTHVEVPCLEPSDLPRFVVPADRKLPRLAKVTYASLHQHLRAHAPEVRDLGDDFPSPERFDAMRLSSLDVVVVGGGRMLVLFGPGEGGAYLVWLTAGGFHKSAHIPADAFPAPLLAVDGDKLRVHVQVEGKRVVHEMLWWGP